MTSTITFTENQIYLLNETLKMLDTKLVLAKRKLDCAQYFQENALITKFQAETRQLQESIELLTTQPLVYLELHGKLGIE